MVTLKEREVKMLEALSKGQNGSLSLEEIARRLGYRPAKIGVLPTLSTLRSMLKKFGEYQISLYGEEGKFEGRLPPKDRWGIERWFLTNEGRAELHRHNPAA